MWRTSDGGETWAREQSGLVHANDVVPSPTDPDVLAAGGYSSIAISYDGGVTWAYIGGPLGGAGRPAFSPDGGTLYSAGTGVAVLDLG